MSKCRSCGAEITWQVTKKGKPIPLDAEPVPDGNLAFSLDGLVVSAGNLGGIASDERFVSHFATCPDADDWRHD